MNKLIVAALAAALLPQSASAALIGLYQFNDAGNLGLDSSGAERHATNNGASFAKAGYQGGAASFDGADWLSASTNTGATTLPKLTWGAWAKVAPGGAGGQALLSNDDGGFDRQLTVDSRGAAVRGWSSFTGSGVLNSGIAPSTTTWTFVAGVYDQALKTVTLYVDDRSFSSDGMFGTSLDIFTIGRNSSFGEFFNGLIDNVFVYDEALSAEQIAGIRAKGFPAASVPEPGTWAMLMGGFGLMGVMMRRRRAASRAHA